MNDNHHIFTSTPALTIVIYIVYGFIYAAISAISTISAILIIPTLSRRVNFLSHFCYLCNIDSFYNMYGQQSLQPFLPCQLPCSSPTGRIFSTISANSSAISSTVSATIYTIYPKQFKIHFCRFNYHISAIYMVYGRPSNQPFRQFDSPYHYHLYHLREGISFTIFAISATISSAIYTICQKETSQQFLPFDLLYQPSFTPHMGIGILSHICYFTYHITTIASSPGAIYSTISTISSLFSGIIYWSYLLNNICHFTHHFDYHLQHLLESSIKPSVLCH